MDRMIALTACLTADRENAIKMQKRKFQILTDSGSDLPDSYFAEHAIECVKLGFVVDGVEYGGESGADMPLHAFYERLRAGAKPSR